MSIDYDRLETLLEHSSRGPWTVDIDEDWNETIVANEAGHEGTDGEQLRFEMIAGNPKADPYLVAMTREIAHDLLRIRRSAQRALKVLEQPTSSTNLHARIILDEALEENAAEDDDE